MEIQKEKKIEICWFLQQPKRKRTPNKSVGSINYIHCISFETAKRHPAIASTVNMCSPCRKYCLIQLPFVTLNRAHLPSHVFDIESRKMSSKWDLTKASRTHTIQQLHRVAFVHRLHYRLEHTNRPASKISGSVSADAWQIGCGNFNGVQQKYLSEF